MAKKLTKAEETAMETYARTVIGPDRRAAYRAWKLRERKLRGDK